MSVCFRSSFRLNEYILYCIISTTSRSHTFTLHIPRCTPLSHFEYDRYILIFKAYKNKRPICNLYLELIHHVHPGIPFQYSSSVVLASHTHSHHIGPSMLNPRTIGIASHRPLPLLLRTRHFIPVYLSPHPPASLSPPPKKTGFCSGAQRSEGSRLIVMYDGAGGHPELTPPFPSLHPLICPCLPR